MNLPPPKKKVLRLPPPKMQFIKLPTRKVFKKEIQDELLTIDNEWQKEWKGMPEFVSEEKLPFHTIHVHFSSIDEIIEFSKCIGQKINTEIRDIRYTPRLWFKERPNLIISHLRYSSDE